MKQGDRHLDDRELLRCLDAERPQPEHLARCWTCRSRLRELEDLTGAIVQLRETYLLPECDGAPPLRPLAAPARAAGPFRWRAVAGMAAGLALLALIWPFEHISAKEVLRRSIDAEHSLTARISRPVLRQSLRLRRVAQGQVKETKYVSWVELPSGRWRTEGGDADLLREVGEAWRVNRLRFDLPLSAEAFAAAFSAADAGSLDYEQGRLTAARGDGPVAEIQLRPTDWHVTAAVLVLGDRRYEIAEAGLEINAFAALHEKLFLPPASASVSPAAGPSLAFVSPPPAPLPGEPREERPALLPIPDLDALEVDVWHAVHRGGCTRGCDLEISREGNHVAVTGLTASQVQREHLLATLRNLEAGHRLTIRVNSLDRAAATAPPPDRRARLDAAPLPIEAFLRDTAPGEPRVTVAALANSVISLADRAESHNRLLRRLLDAFPPERYHRLPPRSQWLLEGMALENIQALRLAITGLRTLQQPVFAQLGGPLGPAPASPDPWTAFASIHALLHALYAGASDTAPVEGVREVAARLAALDQLLATEDSNQPFRSPRR